MSESFEDFKSSFYYGSRSDLSFKFLESMPDDKAADFLQQLLLLVGDAYDTGDVTPIIDLAYQTQIEASGPNPDRPFPWSYEDRPFTPLSKPLNESRIGLMTSSGHFAAGEDPMPFGVEDMTQAEAEDRVSEFVRSAPTLSEIPRDIPVQDIRVRHAGYDIRSARIDHNVTFPRDAVVAAAAEGRVGEVADTLYSFPGVAAQGRIKQLAEQWVERIKGQKIDVMLLVPV